MKKRLAAMAMLTSFAFSAQAQAHTVFSTDTQPSNVRSGPGTNFPVVGQVTDSQGLPVLGKEGDWYKVRLTDGATGYAAAWVTKVLYDDEQMMGMANISAVNIRSGPSDTSTVLGQITPSQTYRVRELQGSWYRIDYNGGSGWAWSAYVTLQAVTAPAPVPAPAPTPTPAPPPSTGPIAQRTAAGRGVTLRVSSANLYLGRSTGYDIIDTARAGESLTYLDMQEGWVRVQTPRGARGWVRGDLIEVWDGNQPFARSAYYAMQENYWQMDYLLQRTVTASTTVRSAANATAPAVVTIAAGALVKLLDGTAGWFMVQLPDGRQGWLPESSTAPSTGYAAPRVGSVKLRTPSAGVRRLEITGNLQGAVVQNTSSHVEVSIPDSNAIPASLEVDDTGYGLMWVDANGVHLNVANRPNVAIIEQTNNRLVIELRPIITAASPRIENGNYIYHFDIAGELVPSTTISGNEVAVNLPGAKVGAGLPGEIRQTTSGSNLVLQFSSQKAFGLKKVAGGYDAIFYSPGLAGKVIMIDPGHGGADPGAGGNGLQEEELNLDVALRMRDALAAQGARVLMTRTTDAEAMPPAVRDKINPADRLRADLDYRTKLANDNKVDIYLSIHANAGTSAARGTETYFSTQNVNSASSRLLAGYVQSELLKALGRVDRGVQDDFFYVIKFTQAPAILAELAFMTNPDDAAVLTSSAYRAKAASGLAAAVVNFFGRGAASSDLGVLRDRLAVQPFVRSNYTQLIQSEVSATQHLNLDTFVQGKKVAYPDVRPYAKGDRTMVPVRFVTEALGATVTWDNNLKQATIVKGSKTIKLTVGSSTAVVNGLTKPIEAAPETTETRTMVPLRFIAEEFGMTVTWLQDTYSIVITSDPLS